MLLLMKSAISRRGEEFHRGAIRAARVLLLFELHSLVAWAASEAPYKPVDDRFGFCVPVSHEPRCHVGFLSVFAASLPP